MINIQAKNRILNLYKEGSSSYEKVKREEYRQLFYAIRPYITSNNKEWNMAVGEFLYNGALSFNRFIGLRPNYIDDDMYSMFCEFLASLQSLDGKYQGRTFFFHLGKNKWKIFRECNLLPYDEDMKTLLDECEEEINKLRFPTENKLVCKNLENQKEEIIGLINDIRSGLIKTRIHTTLPFILTNTKASVNLKVNGVNVKAKISNHSQGSSLPRTEVAEGSTMTTSAPSKWTTTTCEIDIEADCLMDGLELKPNVILQNKEDNRYWTADYDFTYQVISTIWMYIQQQEDISGTWPPLPTDIHYISYQVSGSQIYDKMTTTNPALVYCFRGLNKPTQHYEINDSLPSWSAYTHQFAKVYAKSGQLKESIFWLNVSVEALVEEFIQKTATSKETLAEIEGDEYKFNTAEEILAEQFPEMKGKVQWPQTVIHTSVFIKLKRAVKMSDKACLLKDVMKKYSIVNSNRNALFHGKSVEIKVETVAKAFGAYDWLKENLFC